MYERLICPLPLPSAGNFFVLLNAYYLKPLLFINKYSNEKYIWISTICERSVSISYPPYQGVKWFRCASARGNWLLFGNNNGKWHPFGFVEYDAADGYSCLMHIKNIFSKKITDTRRALIFFMIFSTNYGNMQNTALAT